MKSAIKKYSSTDEYISSFPANTQKKLNEIRKAIKTVVPEAKEVISYQMPAFYHHEVLVWYAAQSKHFGFYPKASGVSAFKKELSKYKHTAGAIQFPIDEPLPIGLIKKITKFRKEEVLKKKKYK